MMSEKQPLISVIVPIYKVEQYLNRCVQSIVDQTYKNLEIILVDDGSPDNSPEMCDAWAEKDDRVQVVHKKNGGVSSARNAGLDAANGAYIGFVDGDDYIEPDMYAQLLQAIQKDSSDMAVCGYYYNQDAVTFPESVCVSAQQAMCYMFDSAANAFEGYCWNKLYCKPMINNYCLRLDLQLIEAEDTNFNFLYLKNSEHVSLISYAGYRYIQRISSVSNTRNQNYRLSSINLPLTFLSECSESVLPYALKWAFYFWMGAINEHAKINNTSVIWQVIRKVKQNRRQFLRLSGISKRNKLQVVLLYCVPHLYVAYLCIRNKRGRK